MIVRMAITMSVTYLYPVYTIQLVVKPIVWQPVWLPCWTNSHCSFNRLSKGLYNRIDNRLYTWYSRLSNHLSDGFDNRL